VNSKVNHDFLKICVILLTIFLYLFVVALNKLASEKSRFFENQNK
jgi:hypothetical protein